MPDAIDQGRRRTLLGLSAGLIAGACPPLAHGDSPTPTPAPALIRRPIPSSGELLPVIGMGTAWSFDVGTGEAERAPLVEILEEFSHPPGRLIDTSPMYGNAERVIGELSAELGIGGRMFLATKVWTEGREAGIRQMEESMRLLGTQRLDLIQVHNLVDWRTQLATLRDWKQAGRVRYIGITHYRNDAFPALEEVMLAEPLDFVQLNYSITTREAEKRLLPLAAERGIGIIANRPFEDGTLFRRVRGRPLPGWAAEIDCASWAQIFLKYIVSHPAVSCAIPSTSKPKHLRDNLAAGTGRLPDAAQRQRMRDELTNL
jgi:aryl-alcohol dehydrogenase-like predicted oxidoreductase